VREELDPNPPATPDPTALDPRSVELVLACLVAGCTFIVLPRSIFIASLLTPVLAVYAAALVRRWSPAGRLGALLLLLAVVGVAPTLAVMDGYHTTGRAAYGHDGGVIVTGRATEELLAGHNPYTVDYTGSLRGSPLLLDGAWTQNPVRDHYPYSPGTFLAQLPFTVAALALGQAPDARWLYLVVYLAAAIGLARWSLRQRGDLVVPLFVLANPMFLQFLWLGETDVLLVAGLTGLAWALHRDRPVLAGFALGAALSTKLLLAPFALVFLAWLAARAWRGVLDRRTALRTAGALALPVVVTAVPFVLWNAGAMVQDMVLFHAGLAPPRYPIAGAGFPALLFELDVIHDRGAAAPAWSTLVPTLAALAAACAFVWRRTRVVDLLGAGAAVSLASVYFSRAFTTTYWWVPATLLCLAVITRTGPDPAEPAAAPRAVPEAPPEMVSTAAR
jgi:hypothetical protein